jgi:hypothetical protein
MEKFRGPSDYSRHPESANFFIVANGNFIDMCVLEWCKLFADHKDKHHWQNIVADKAHFEKELFGRSSVSKLELGKQVRAMRRYRDKFIAHLDSDRIMQIPSLDIPKKTTWFYYAYVVANEAGALGSGRFDPDIESLYRKMEKEAEAAYGRIR